MKIKHLNKKIITGFSLRTNNETEMNPSTGGIAALWQKFDDAVPVDYKNAERVYGVYSAYESDHTGMFSVLAGFDGESFPSDLGLEQIEIPEGKYLVFSKKGAMPQIAFEVWTEIWQYFADQNSEYKRAYSVDFEYYPGPDEIEVNIAIL